MSGPLEALRIRDFRLVLIGTTLANAAHWMQLVALSWLVYDLTSSGALLGTVNLVRCAAILSVALPAGALIDRTSPRTLLFRINGSLLVASFVLGLVLTSGHTTVWPLFIFSFLSGSAQAFDQPLRQTMVFSVVPRSVAPNAVAWVQTGWGLMRSVGPGLAGVLIQWFGPGGSFLVQAGAYGLISLNILRIQLPTANADAARRAFLVELREGVQCIAQEPMLRSLILMGSVLPLFIVPIVGVLPAVYAKKVFQGGPQVVGLLFSACGVGAIVGGVVAASLGRVERKGLLLLGALFLLSLTLTAFAFSATLWVALPLLALAGFFEVIHLTTTQTVLQLSIPDHLRGRVTSIVTLNLGLISAGSFFAGVGSDWIGVRGTTVALGGTAAAIAVLAFVFLPTVRGYRLARGAPAELSPEAFLGRLSQDTPCRFPQSNGAKTV